MNVAVVGIGRMGAAMLQSIIDAGHHVAVYDASPTATAPFAAAGNARVRVAESPADAASDAEVVDVVVNTDEQVLDACLGQAGIVAGAKPGAVVLIHSTIALDTLREVAEVAAETGVRVLDAALSGAMGHYSVGDLCVMVGGDADALAAARPVIDVYGGLVIHLGPLGAGLDAKLALNLLRYLYYVTGQEAGRLANGAGIDSTMMREIVQRTGAANFVGDFSQSRSPEDYERRLNNAETAQKDLRAAVARGAELGLALPTAEFAIERMHQLWAVEPREGKEVSG